MLLKDLNGFRQNCSAIQTLRCHKADLTVSGVNDVDSFDEKSVVAYTDYGQLTIQGERLNIKRLSVETGELTVEGEISALIYTELVKLTYHCIGNE